MNYYGSEYYTPSQPTRGKTLYMFYIRGPFENEFLMEWLIEMELWNMENSIENYDDVNENKTVFLYGWTYDKSVAKDFQKQRNMKKFVMFKRNLENVSDEELKDFFDVYYDAELFAESFYTRGSKGVVMHPLVATRLEINYVSIYLEDFDTAMEELPDPDKMEVILDCLKKEYQTSLKRVGFYELLNQVYEYQHHGECISGTIDELYVLMMYFGETF